jgi:hypothetical protein
LADYDHVGRKIDWLNGKHRLGHLFTDHVRLDVGIDRIFE